MKVFFRLLPWIALVALLAYLWQIQRNSLSPVPQQVVNHNTLLKEMETLGKMELVKYNFKEITELTDISETYFNLFKLGPDQKIALISEGQAVGCVDLTRVQESDMRTVEDTLYIRLPNPEICYYKLDLENTRIYSLQTNPFEDDSEFIQEAYTQAEREIREAALRSGILGQTKSNATLVLTPIFEQLSGKPVVVQFGMNQPLPSIK